MNKIHGNKQQPSVQGLDCNNQTDLTEPRRCMLKRKKGVVDMSLITRDIESFISTFDSYIPACKHKHTQVQWQMGFRSACSIAAWISPTLLPNATVMEFPYTYAYTQAIDIRVNQSELIRIVSYQFDKIYWLISLKFCRKMCCTAGERKMSSVCEKFVGSDGYFKLDPDFIEITMERNKNEQQPC